MNTASVILVPGLIMFSQEGDLISTNPSVVMNLLRPTVIGPLVSNDLE